MTDPFRADEYWENRLRAHYHERGVGDISLSRAYNSWLYAVRRRVFRRLLRQLQIEPADTRVLDVGSGTGVYVREWQSWGARQVTGCDITEIAVDRLARSFPAVRFLRVDIGASDLDGLAHESYEVISALDVLFHIVDDSSYNRAIANIASLLVPGGWFIYSDNLVHREMRISHYVSREETDILGTLRLNGFQVRRRVPMFVLMNQPVRTSSRLVRRWFSIVYRLARRGEVIGAFTGAALYPIELAATRLIRNGPSTEIVVCQRM